MTSAIDTVTIRPRPGAFSATVTVPGDKSLSHRSLIFAGFANGTSIVSGLGTGEDIQSTKSILADLGVVFDGDSVMSPGVREWTEPANVLDCGNSGTTMRLMAGALSAASFESVLVGDESLSSRPMERLVGPLGALGGRVETSNGTAPMTVGGADVTRRPADAVLPVASAQLRTAFALAAIQGDAPSTVDGLRLPARANKFFSLMPSRSGDPMRAPALTDKRVTILSLKPPDLQEWI
ncbi:MAG: hypothetical protein IIB04_05770, partial [Acidobacteria bacterium]|nr:hypothetical protein [Acidobacteriota bacterium]